MADEYLAVRAHLAPDLQDLLDFGYNSGWRKGEILDLRWGDLDTRGEVIRLRAEKSKNGQPRILPMSEPIMNLIGRRWEKRTTLTDHVFHRGGRPIRNFDTAWTRAVGAAGLPDEGPSKRRFHDCRRTTARDLLRAGVPQRTARDITGHKTSSIFDRYAIQDEVTLREAAEKLARFREEQAGKAPLKVVTLARTEATSA